MAQVLRHFEYALRAGAHLAVIRQLRDDLERIVHVMAERQRQLLDHLLVVADQAENIAAVEGGICH